MYLDIGGETLLRTENILGIFDLDNTTTSKRTREFLEARLLANIIRTLGDKVAAGTPFAMHDIQVQTSFRTNDEGVHAMALQGGGLMLCLPNLSREAGVAHVTWKGE